MRGPGERAGERLGTRPAHVVRVTGGSAGVAATWAGVLELAEVFQRSAHQQEEWAARSRSVAGDADLVESGLLAPATCAAAEAAVLATVAALGVDARAWQAEAVGVRGAIGLLRAADDAAQAGLDAVDRDLGFAAGFAVGRFPLVDGAVALGLWQTGLPSDRLLTDHPTAFTQLMDGSGGLVEGLAAGAGLPVPDTPRVEDAARLAAAAYGDEGHPVLRPVVVPLLGDTTQPASVRDLIDHLDRVASLSPDAQSPLNGTISVQTVTGADGVVRHVAYLPGTDDLTTTPWSQDQDVRDMATNLQLMGGEEDTYQRGIVQALHDAGVRPGEPVALVGHSQGGMEAAALLARHGSGDAGDTAGLDITDVVTAGSPTAQVGAFPVGSHVLSLEQRGDIVPLLDGRAPVDSVPQTTVVFDASPDGGVLAHHLYPAYLAGASCADASGDPSVRDAIASLHRHGFLGDGSAVTVRSQVFQIRRG